jgi:hypothetical protein
MKIAVRAPVWWLILGSGLPLLPVVSVAGQSDSSLSRDYTYYAGNVTNPLLKKPLYYNDAGNVLADLESFQSLHIQYSSCA